MSLDKDFFRRFSVWIDVNRNNSWTELKYEANWIFNHNFALAYFVSFHFKLLRSKPIHSFLWPIVYTFSRASGSNPIPPSVLFINRRRHHNCNNAIRKTTNNAWSPFYERTMRFTSENRATRENRLERGYRFRGNSLRILPGDLTNRKRSTIVSLPGKARWDIGWEILHRWRSLVSRSVNQPVASSAIGYGRSILIVVRNLAKASASDDAHRIIVSRTDTLRSRIKAGQMWRKSCLSNTAFFWLIDLSYINDFTGKWNFRKASVLQ